MDHFWLCFNKTSGQGLCLPFFKFYGNNKNTELTKQKVGEEEEEEEEVVQSSKFKVNATELANV